MKEIRQQKCKITNMEVKKKLWQPGKQGETMCTEDAAPSCNPALDGSQRGRESTTQDAEARRCQKMENVYPT